MASTLKNAIKDLIYLLNRGYSRDSAINFVSLRYDLNKEEREILKRGVFSDTESEKRKAKKVPIKTVKNETVVVDGYNVLVTSRAVINNKPIFLGTDGFLRDIESLNSRKSILSFDGLKVAENIMRILKNNNAKFVIFVFDSQVSKSGKLAKEVEKLLNKFQVKGVAKTSKSADDEIISLGKITASSDTYIIDNVDKCVDLPMEVLKDIRKLWKREIDFDCMSIKV